MKKYLLTLAVTAFILSSLSLSSAQTCTTLTKPLSSGSKGSEVTALQQFLYDQKYLAVKPNGYYGAGTVAAVKAFQKKNNLVVNGFVGPAARGKIKNISCIQTIDTPKLDVTPPVSLDTNSKLKETASTKNNLTFSENQLGNLKVDLLLFYNKYQNYDTDKEPFKSNYEKEFDAIFLTNLGVEKVTTDNSAVLRYPKISSMLEQFKKTHPKPLVASSLLKPHPDGVGTSSVFNLTNKKETDADRSSVNISLDTTTFNTPYLNISGSADGINALSLSLKSKNDGFTKDGLSHIDVVEGRWKVKLTTPLTDGMYVIEFFTDKYGKRISSSTILVKITEQVTKLPTCSVETEKKQYAYGDDAKVVWFTNGAEFITFYFDRVASGARYAQSSIPLQKVNESGVEVFTKKDYDHFFLVNKEIQEPLKIKVRNSVGSSFCTSVLNIKK